MNKCRQTKWVHEGIYVAEVEVELIDDGEGWSSYLSVEDAYRLDEVRIALRQGNVDAAAKLVQVCKLTPLAVA